MDSVPRGAAAFPNVRAVRRLALGCPPSLPSRDKSAKGPPARCTAWPDRPRGPSADSGLTGGAGSERCRRDRDFPRVASQQRFCRRWRRPGRQERPTPGTGAAGFRDPARCWARSAMTATGAWSIRSTDTESASGFSRNTEIVHQPRSSRAVGNFAGDDGPAKAFGAVQLREPQLQCSFGERPHTSRQLRRKSTGSAAGFE